MGFFSSLAFSFCTFAELWSSLRTRLAIETHAEWSIARLAYGSADNP